MLNPCQCDPLVEAALGKPRAGQKAVKAQAIYKRARKLKKLHQDRAKAPSKYCKVEIAVFVMCAIFHNTTPSTHKTCSCYHPQPPVTLQPPYQFAPAFVDSNIDYGNSKTQNEGRNRSAESMSSARFPCTVNRHGSELPR